MKAFEIMNTMFALAEAGDYRNTCDTCKAGDPEREVTRVAVTMFATPEVIRQAAEWGAELLITHEPTYYNHMDHHSTVAVECAKRKLIEATGMVLYRYHDHPHGTKPDIIGEGMLRDMALAGEVSYTETFDLVRVKLECATTPRELAAILEKNLDLAHIRIAGAADTPMKKVSCMFGTPGGVYEELQRDDCEIMITGEACEWALCEYVRDASQLGFAKALLVPGHIGSERNGMIYTADLVKKLFPALEVKYFECGEVYTYTDR